MDWNRITSIFIALVDVAIEFYVFTLTPLKKDVVIFFCMMLVSNIVALSMIWSDSARWGVNLSKNPFRHYYNPRYNNGCATIFGVWILLLMPIIIPSVVLLIQWMG